MICLAQGHNTATRVGFEPPTSGSRVQGVKHQATAPPSGFGGQDMTPFSIMPNTVRCAGFHYQQVTTSVAGLGIVAFTEGLHNSSIFLVTPQV